MLEDFDILDRKSERQKDAQLLQCPSCGWEDIKPDRLNVTTTKAYEQMKSLDTTVPECSNFVDKPYEEYKTHRYRIADIMYQGRCNNIIPCPSFPSSLPRYTGYSADVLTAHTYYPQGTRNYIRQQMTSGPIVMSKLKSYTKEAQLSSEQLFPEKRTKQVGTSIKQYDKGI